MKSNHVLLWSLVASMSLPLAARAADFPGVPNVPASPYHYGGFYKNHPVKLVIGIDDPARQLQRSLVQTALAIRYLKGRHEAYRFHVVFYGNGVQAADRFNQQFAQWGPLIESLHRAGVTFTVCHNAMMLQKIQEKDVYPFMTLIPSGILSIAEYQMKGYAYVTN